MSRPLPAPRGRSAAVRLLPALFALLPMLASAAPGLNGVLRISSDYLNGTYTKSDGRPSLQANVDWLAGNGVYAGSWLSAIDFGGAHAEALPYLGFHRKLAEDFSADLSLAGYLYERRVFGRRADYGELYGAVHFRDLLTTGFSFAPDPYGQGGTATNLKTKLKLPLSDVVSLGLGIGHEWALQAYHYDCLMWSAGLNWYPLPSLAIELGYQGARQIRERPHVEPSGAKLSDTLIDDRVVMSVSWGL